MRSEVNKIRAISIFSALLGMLLWMGACSQSEKKKEEIPEAPAAAPNNHELTQQREFIELEMPVSELTGLKQGDTFQITNTSLDTTYQLVVRRNQEVIPGSVGLSANMPDRETGFASLVIQGEKLTGSLRFYKQEKRYRIQYDSASSGYYLSEILPEDVDELEGSTPLEGPRN